MGVPFDITWPMVIAGAGIGALGWFGVDELALRHWRHETASAFGSASWAAKRDLEQTGLFGAEGVVLGRVGGRLLRHRMDRHLLTIASNRSGKGVSSIIPNLLTWPGSLVVIDPKGENAAVTARHRREMGQEVHILDPLGITGLRGSRFNPLLWLDPQGKNFVEDANLVADSLHMSQATKEEMFFSNESKAWVAGEIMHIVTTEPPATRTLATLRAHLTHPKDEFDWLLDDMTDNSAAFGLAARAASRLRQKADRERSGVISTAQAETHFLDSPSMTEVMAASDFDLGQLKRGAMTIYLVLPAERLATHGRWLRLMISLCIATLTRDRMPPRHPVLMVLDEFAALGRLQAIETAMGLLAGYGVQLWPILQDLSQLQDLYPHRWRSFLANAGVVQAFGVNDAGTAEYLSSLLGTRTVIVRHEGRSMDGKHRGSENYGPASRPLLMPHEILRLQENRQLVLIQGKAPILAERVRYYADAEFAGLFDANPMLGY
jgi:type IV secretion system protein VirD4